MKHALPGVILLVLFQITNIVHAQQPLRVACYGSADTKGTDNLAQFNRVTYGWRYALWEKIDSAGYSVDFVGTQNTILGQDKLIDRELPVSPYTGHTFDPDHNAIWGGTTTMMRDSIQQWLRCYTPDVALIHAGTDDKETDADVTLENLRFIIRTLQHHNPEVTVLLAKTITPWKPFNDKIEALALELNTPTGRVIFVDQQQNFINDPKQPLTDTHNWVFPNEKGERKMAQKWFEAFELVFDHLTPMIPIDLELHQLKSRSVTLTWMQSVDNRGIWGYNIYVNNVRQNCVPVTDTCYFLTNLNPGKRYEVAVSAIDLAGNQTQYYDTQLGFTTPYTLTFVVTNENRWLRGAQVVCNGYTRYTDNTGSVEFADIPESVNLSYTISRSGYQTYSAKTDVFANRYEHVSLLPTLQNKITVGNGITLTTDAQQRSIYLTHIKGCTVEVFNALGKSIRSVTATSTELLLSLDNAPEGIYYIKISSGEEVYTHKVSFK